MPPSFLWGDCVFFFSGVHYYSCGVSPKIVHSESFEEVWKKGMEWTPFEVAHAFEAVDCY